MSANDDHFLGLQTLTTSHVGFIDQLGLTHSGMP